MEQGTAMLPKPPMKYCHQFAQMQLKRVEEAQPAINTQLFEELRQDQEKARACLK